MQPVGVFHAPDRVERLRELLSVGLGPTPPVADLATWTEALAGDLHLFFEVNLPSPPAYRHGLRDNITSRALIPYVREAAGETRERLEGATHVDALLLCEQTGFAAASACHQSNQSGSALQSSAASTVVSVLFDACLTPSRCRRARVRGAWHHINDRRRTL